MARKFGIAVVGCGRWGSHYVRILDQDPDVGVLTVYDEREDRLQAIVRRSPNVRLARGLHECLAADDVDAVVIATPATTHAAIGTTCLEAGKHVLMEKPITTTAADAAAMMELAESRGLTLMVGHTFLFNPAVLKVRELVMHPGLGKIHYLYARRTNLGPIRPDVNAVWDLAAHDISIFNFMLESVPLWASAVGARVLGQRFEDVGFITLAYPHGIVGHIHVSWADPSKVRELVVVAANERIVFNDMDPQESVRVYQRGVSSNGTSPLGPATFGEFKLTMRDGDIISPRIEPSEPLGNQIAHFLSCLRTGQAPATDAATGRDVVAVLEAIDESMSADGVPVRVGDTAARPRFGTRYRRARVADPVP
jgi:predicted dehydrogenase